MEEGFCAVVNVRQQHVSELRTLFHLEQVSVSNHLGILEKIRRIKYNIDEGLSFCFNSISDAAKVVNLITGILPALVQWNKIDPYLFSVEIVPICCGDLIILPSNIAASLGPNIGPIVICTRVARTFTLLDPFTLTRCFLKADRYWDAPFTPSFSRHQLVEYVVLGIEKLDEEEEEEEVEENKQKNKIFGYADAAAAKKYRLANAIVARVKDIGNNNHTTFQIRTHLSRILKPGDHALGYDLPEGDPILITKISFAKEENGRVIPVQDKWESDYQLFLKDLQQDPKLLFDRNPTNCHPSGPPIRSPFRRPFYPLEDLLDG
ncbi:hypothetical protein MtrunA17_Chr5g0396211 [Medicago truncatula]|uniref:Nonsense-mediated mRNA decay protein n=1 Tax=Medicago truncatula TaxID=3880 RepID=G7K7Y2_MEDTR|nr:60S ribosomal export protein NMD3 [Medicago truncatula]AES93887.1 nonsense-mediated mRNA decay protein [Medicago truncatula]RHN53471.1 hypothetical protein MtrunA17_Chr5g0396211 [Medicago truncatula]